MSFKFNTLHELLQTALEARGHKEPTKIQEQAIPMLLDEDGDFFGQAQTGTGKTGAFLLPLLEKLIANPEAKALILAPTRELAIQVADEFKAYAQNTTLKHALVYGGSSYRDQIRAIRDHRPQVIIGTPGRTIDLYEKGIIDFSDFRFLVCDEADEMLNRGFLEDVKLLIKAFPKDRRIWMFSATLPKQIRELLERDFKNPRVLTIKSNTLSNKDVAQFFYPLHRSDYSKALGRIAESQANFSGIVFCETKIEVKELTSELSEQGLSVGCLHGDLKQFERDEVMRLFKNRKLGLIVCTDVAARGLDIDHIEYVFNMRFPRNRESYIHRIGRTGRAGKKGHAITFVHPRDARLIAEIERWTNQKIEKFHMPTLKSLKDLKIQQVTERLITGSEERPTDQESYSNFEKALSDLERDEIIEKFYDLFFARDFDRIEEHYKLQKVRLDKPEFTRTRNVARRGGGQQRDRGRDQNRRRRPTQGGRSGRRSQERRSYR